MNASDPNDRLFSVPKSRMRARVIIEEDDDGRRVHAIEYLDSGRPVIMSPARMVFLLQRTSMEFTMALLTDTEIEEYVNAANNQNDQNIQ